MPTKTKSKAASTKAAASLLLREKKIEAYKQMIEKASEQLSALKPQQDVWKTMELVGLNVTHRKFGAGVVTAQDAAVLLVTFDCGEKRFMLPSAFAGGFLQTDHPGVVAACSRLNSLEEQINTLEKNIASASAALKILEQQ